MAAQSKIAELRKTLDEFLQATTEQSIRSAASTTVAILTIDLETQVIVQVDPLIELMFGYSTGELKGQSIHVLVPDEVAQSHFEHIRRFNRNPGGRTMGTRGMPIHGKRKDGSTFPAAVGIAFLQETNSVGQHRRLGVATVLDLTAVAGH